MKATLFFLIYLMSLSFVHSQEINCDEKQKELSEFVTNKEFKKATTLLSTLRSKCKNQSEEIYLLGITTLKYNVDVASDVNKEIAIKDLLKLYDQYDANYPNNNNGNLVNKAMLLYDNKSINETEIYSFLNKAFETNKTQFTNPNALYIYFKLLNDKFISKKEGISFDQLLEKYNDIIVVIEKNSNTFPDKAIEFTNAKQACKSLIKEHLTSENLISLAERKFESNSQNPDWLESTANLLSEKCAASSIFGKIASQLHQVRPSSKSAYHLANYNLKNRNQTQAIDYFDQSATLATDKLEKAKTYFTLATIISASDKGRARKMIYNAIDNDATNGSYYILLTSLYSNSISECSVSTLEQKAIYKLINQTAQKAAQVEPRLKPTADQLAKDYSKITLTKQETEQVKKMGGKVIIGCWINETVQF